MNSFKLIQTSYIFKYSIKYNESFRMIIEKGLLKNEIELGIGFLPVEDKVLETIPSLTEGFKLRYSLS